MTELEGSRVAEILITGAAGKATRGSGYRIAHNLVLTAAHVVAGAERINARFEGGTSLQWRCDARVAWAGKHADLAVLRLVDPPLVDLQSAEFGQVGGRTAAVVVCRAVGFPLFKLRCGSGDSDVEPPYRDSHQAEGSISTLSNRKSGTFEVVLHAGPDGLPPCVRDIVPPPDSWGGMSGAALWSAGRIVGVVAEHHVGEGPRLLTAARVDALYEPEMASDLQELVALELLPASLEDLPDVTTEHLAPDLIPAERLEALRATFAAELSASGPYLELVGGKRSEQPGGASRAPLAHFVDAPGARILLVGDGGQGKSTTLLKLAADAAAEAIRDERAPVPVYARLALVDTTDRAGFDALAEVLADSLALDPALMTAMWRTATRPLLFLLDGLNEIRPERQQAVSLALQRLFASRRHSYLVTSRPTPAATRLIAAVPGLDVVDLMELDDDQVEEYMGERDARFEAGAPERSLPDIVRNPFVLWALTESAGRDGVVALPKTLGKTYETFIDEYVFGQREPAKNPPPTRYDYVRVKRPVLGRIAHDMTLRGVTRAPLEPALEDELIETLEAIEVGAKRRKSVMPEGWMLDDLVAEVVENSILRHGDGTLEFFHESVQHYFTAIELARRGSEAVASAIPALIWRHVDLGANPGEPRFGSFERAAIMLAGLMPDAGALVEALLARNPLVAARVAAQSEMIAEPAHRCAVRFWLELLERRHERYRWMGCRCLLEAGLEDPSIGSRLTALVLEEPNDTVARAGRKALSRHASEDNVRELIARALEELGPYHSDPAVEALRELPAAAPVRLLLGDWRAGGPREREQVETLLANLRLEAVVAELDGIASDRQAAEELRSRVEQRRRILEAEGGRGIRFAGDRLVSTLDRIGNLEQRRRAAARELGGAAIHELQRLVRNPAGFAGEVAPLLLIERVGDEALPELVNALLTTYDHRVVEGIIDALRRCPPDAVTEALHEPLKSRARPLALLPLSVEQVLHGPWKEIASAFRRHAHLDFTDDLVPERDGDDWEVYDRGLPGNGIRRYRLWRHGDVLALADLSAPLNAIHGLGAAGGTRALPLLLECLADASTRVRAAAASALAATGSPAAVPAVVGRLEQELKNPSRDIIEAILTALGDLGELAFPAAVPALLQALETVAHEGSYEVAWRLSGPGAGTGPVCQTLESIGGQRDGVEWACSALSSPEEDRRLTAVAVLRRWREQETRLTRLALADQSATVRLRAAEALRWYPGDQALPVLLDSLATGDAGARAAAARALGAFQDESAVEPLVDRLQDRDAIARVEAASAILMLKSDDHFELATEALVREAATSPAVAGLVVSRLRATNPDAIGRLSAVTLEYVARYADDADAREAAYAALPSEVEEHELQAMDAALAAGRPEEAIERANSWLGAPQDAAFSWIYHYARGIAEMELDRFEAALADAEAAVRLRWVSPAYRLQAEALEALARPLEALEAAQKAAEIDPDEGAIQAELAAYASKAGEGGRAVTAARAACKLSSDDPSVLLAVVPILLMHGVDDEAAAIVKQAAEATSSLDTENIAALASTSSAALEKMNSDRARDLADEIRRLLLTG